MLCDGASPENIASTVVDCTKIETGHIGFFRVGLIPKSKVINLLILSFSPASSCIWTCPVFYCALQRCCKSSRRFRRSTGRGTLILLLNMISPCHSHKGTENQKKRKKEEVETLHPPRFHLNKTRPSEISHSAQTLNTHTVQSLKMLPTAHF